MVECPYIDCRIMKINPTLSRKSKSEAVRGRHRKSIIREGATGVSFPLRSPRRLPQVSGILMKTFQTSDISLVFRRDDIFIRWMNISGSFGMKKPPVSPRIIHLGIKTIDLFHGLYVSYFPQIVWRFSFSNWNISDKNPTYDDVLFQHNQIIRRY